jgi:hypothetical protein
MRWHFEKSDFLQWCAESGVEAPPELIQEKPQPRNMEELIERELERLNSKEPDPMTKLLRELIQLDTKVERIFDDASELSDSLDCSQIEEEDRKAADKICFAILAAQRRLREIYFLAGKLAAELEAHS